MGKGNNYNTFINNEDGNVKVIFEIGSRDGLDGITAYKRFNAEKCYIFECNPTLLEQCEKI